MSSPNKTYYRVASISVTGIKCDCETCDFKDDSVIINDYEDYLDKPCPKCGENLLTEEDLLAALKITVAAQRLEMFLNRWLPEFILRYMAKGEKRRYKIDRPKNGRLKLGKRIS